LSFIDIQLIDYCKFDILLPKFFDRPDLHSISIMFISYVFVFNLIDVCKFNLRWLWSSIWNHKLAIILDKGIASLVCSASFNQNSPICNTYVPLGTNRQMIY